MNLKKLSLSTLIFLPVFLVGCENNDTKYENVMEKIEMFVEVTDFPSRGVWNDNIYTNDFLGFSITIPDTWAILSDEEIEIENDLGADMLDIERMSETPLGLTAFMDMMAIDSFTGTSIVVSFERLLVNPISIENYIDINVRSIENIGFKINYISTETTRIGNHDWHYIDTFFEVLPGVNMYTRMFITIYQGFSSTIGINYTSFSYNIDDIFHFFNFNS